MEKIIDEKFYKNWAIDELISESFTDLSPFYSQTKDKVDYADWRQDVFVDDDGDVAMASEYKLINNGSHDESIVDTKKIFSKSELKTMFLELIKENEPEAYDAYVTVNINKN